MPVSVDPEHHIARYCSHQKLIPIEPVAVKPFAFELRPAGNGKPAEPYLSVNHCEHHQGHRLQQLRCILGDLAAKNYKTNSSGAFAVLNSGRTVGLGAVRDVALRIRRRHHPQDASYASIEGMPADNTDGELLQLLADEASEEVHRVSDIP